MPLALVRRPGPKLADGLVTHQERVAVDVEQARRQWDAYVAALAAHGWAIGEVEPVDDCPDAVFVEDAVVAFDNFAVVTGQGATSQLAETRGAGAVARKVGLEVERIEAPGTLDGGDVLKVGRTTRRARRPPPPGQGGGRSASPGLATPPP